MKLKPFVFISFLLLTSLACQALSTLAGPSLVGRWEGEYEGDSVALIFYDDGTMTGIFNEDAQNGTYSTDTSTSPAELDIIFDGQDGGMVVTIFEFVDNDTIRMENSSPGDSRPTSFSDFILLHREK